MRSPLGAASIVCGRQGISKLQQRLDTVRAVDSCEIAERFGDLAKLSEPAEPTCPAGHSKLARSTDLYHALPFFDG
jgi:hypothetical protein